MVGKEKYYRFMSQIKAEEMVFKRKSISGRCVAAASLAVFYT